MTVNLSEDGSEIQTGAATSDQGQPVVHIPAVQNKHTDTPKRANPNPGTVAEIDFVIELIDKLEAMSAADPDGDVSLTVDGKWEASFVSAEAKVTEGDAADQE